MNYPMIDFGGEGPPMVFASGNGFPPATYQPLLQPFTGRFRVLSLPPRPLWQPPPPPGELRSWHELAADLLNGMRQHGLTEVIGVGHSLGGACMVLAALAEPERFRALVLLDPTLLPPAALAAIRVMGMLGLGARFPLVRGALRRRARFESVEQAFAYWRQKPLFDGWPDETLRLYAESITRPADGGGVKLAWPPQWEARIYRTVITDIWREVPKLRGLLPVLVVRGEHTNTFTAASERAMRRLVPDAAYVTIPGHGHLFPMSAPDEARRLIEAWLAKSRL